ncbi:hypothetical protein JOQ06_002261 [Pogonophryne albipinna]|uniref:Uncharacterized protein n=1 Tax=Pogonophryne albipinna TaxID=1090488 RepID=A0AAD6B7E9_9TELE|nr:hypothetical protein JOQ06_002261 [Pogonophryne albipinna]
MLCYICRRFNKQLNKVNLEVTELESQFPDGVYLILLMGLLEDYFVPLLNFFLTPESFEQKLSTPPQKVEIVSQKRRLLATHH